MGDAVVSTNFVDKRIHDYVVNEDAQKQTPLDTCLKWAPFALLMTCDACGLKTRHNYKLHIIQVIAGNIMLNAAVQPLKKSLNRARPNGHSKSFPSAHTATGFLTSEIINQELRENYPALKYSGYA